MTWTKGIDPKTGKPLDYDPTRDIQLYAAPAAAVADKGTRQICPYVAGGTNFWPSSYSRRTGLLYMPTHEGCAGSRPTPAPMCEAGSPAAPAARPAPSPAVARQSIRFRRE